VRTIDEGAAVNDETRSDSPTPGVPAESDAPVQATTFLTETWGVIRILALLALMLVLAGVLVRALQLVMGLLGFAAS
jgi:hypothetical protein